MNKLENEEYVKEDIPQIQTSEKKIILEDVKKLNSADILKEKNDTKSEIIASEKKPYPDIIKGMSIFIRDYITNNISLGDSKAGIFIGAVTGVLTITYLHGPEMFKKSLKTWAFFEFTSFIGCLLLVISIYFSLRVVWPRTLTSKKKGLVSWVHIANYKDVTEYVKEIFSTNESQIIENLYELNYDLSSICNKKYINLKLAFVIGFIGIAICIFVLIMG
ncbi:MAG: hypothetical protein JW983_04710 [Elusimicrobia bacterium]|nr:hypothetical protein [Elusimicrobiota bacterium]